MLERESTSRDKLLFYSRSGSQQNDKLHINAAFALCSFVEYLITAIILVGSQDILVGTDIQTSAVLIAQVFPYLLVSVVFPYIAKKVSYFTRFLCFVILDIAGILLLSFVKNAMLKLAAVCLFMCGCCVYDVSLVALTSYFKPSVLSAYSAGTGVGLLVGSLYYTGMYVTHSLPHSLPRPLSSPTYPPTRSLTHALSHPLTHSLNHSLIFFIFFSNDNMGMRFSEYDVSHFSASLPSSPCFILLYSQRNYHRHSNRHTSGSHLQKTGILRQRP